MRTNHLVKLMVTCCLIIWLCNACASRSRIVNRLEYAYMKPKLNTSYVVRTVGGDRFVMENFTVSYDSLHIGPTKYLFHDDVTISVALRDITLIKECRNLPPLAALTLFLIAIPVLVLLFIFFLFSLSGDLMA